MNDLTLRSQVQTLIQARQILNSRSSHLYSPEITRGKAQELYGRAISDRTWSRWQEKVGAINESPYSEATHLLLCILAHLLRGSGPEGLKHKIPRAKLATVAMAVSAQGLSPTLPESLTYDELRERCELRAMQSYCDRHHRRHGLKKSQKVYSRSEAQEIIAQYPNWLTHVSNA